MRQESYYNSDRLKQHLVKEPKQEPQTTYYHSPEIIHVTALFPSYRIPFALELYKMLTKWSISILKSEHAITAFEQLTIGKPVLSQVKDHKWGLEVPQIQSWCQSSWI